eukprot:GHVL01025084.1.p1 GENE.GHVL01025084.1~~GHVL01025084.1.p1  ORF type:complete len:283 (+),score=36.81 GHVL01025084.1:110-958(+)
MNTAKKPTPEALAKLRAFYSVLEMEHRIEDPPRKKLIAEMEKTRLAYQKALDDEDLYHEQRRVDFPIAFECPVKDKKVVIAKCYELAIKDGRQLEPLANINKNKRRGLLRDFGEKARGLIIDEYMNSDVGNKHANDTTKNLRSKLKETDKTLVNMLSEARVYMQMGGRTIPAALGPPPEVVPNAGPRITFSPERPRIRTLPHSNIVLHKLLPDAAYLTGNDKIGYAVNDDGDITPISSEHYHAYVEGDVEFFGITENNTEEQLALLRETIEWAEKELLENNL